MVGTVYLGGGGSAEQEAQLWRETFHAGDSVVIWPFAHATIGARESSIAWMRNALAPYALRSIEAWTSSHIENRALSGVDVVCIPGGNTFSLLHELRSTGLLRLLREHLRDGGRLYGGSAGAVLAGADIGIALVADPNDVGLSDTDALDLLGGMDVLPHYTARDREMARAHSELTGRHVLCLPEASGVIVTGERFRNTGPEPIELVGFGNARVLRAGEECSAGFET